MTAWEGEEGGRLMFSCLINRCVMLRGAVRLRLLSSALQLGPRPAPAPRPARAPPPAPAPRLASGAPAPSAPSAAAPAAPVEPARFERACEETLESLCDYFEEIVESASHLQGADVTYGDGVLTVKLGEPYGTYVINRQTPNKQIWLSSPTSGPKRYDLILNNGGYWIYKHDGMTLHQLLQTEIPQIVKADIDFSKCAHSSV